MEHRKTPDILDDLKAIKSLIEKPGSWIQNDYAKDEYGMTTHSNSPTAVCFCTLGAMKRTIAMGSHNVGNRRADVIEALERFMDGASIPDFNDHATHEEVIEVINKAIVEVESQLANNRWR